MNITHYITFDSGQGPVSLVSIERDGEERMIRIRHDARFESVAQVDPDAARDAVANSGDLGEATTTVDPRYAARITQEAINAATGMGMTDQALRWDDQGRATTFATEADAQAWESAKGPLETPVVRRRRRVMMG